MPQSNESNRPAPSDAMRNQVQVFHGRSLDQEPEHPVRERVRAQSTSARLALEQARQAAGAPGPAEWTFQKDSDGAPLAYGSWSWTITHDAWRVAAAVHTGPVGVDLERIAKRRPALVRRVLCSSEQDLFGDDSALTFIRAWTAKEAVLKAAGVGIAELSLCRVQRIVDDEQLVLSHREQECRVLQKRIGEHLLAVHIPGLDWTVEWRACSAPLDPPQSPTQLLNDS